MRKNKVREGCETRREHDEERGPKTQKSRPKAALLRFRKRKSNNSQAR